MFERRRKFLTQLDNDNGFKESAMGDLSDKFVANGGFVPQIGFKFASQTGFVETVFRAAGRVL